jgi:mono/diheme cytochrome c family protein
MKLKYFTGFFILVVFLYSCDKNRNHPGYIYSPDMTYSTAYETYSENPNFDDGMTMRTPVEGTIPRGFVPFQYDRNDTDMVRAGKELRNPLTYSDENVQAGKIIYDRYCLLCHGQSGDGQGPIFVSGLYPFPPASLINDKMKNKPDGEMYHQITLGWGIMGEYGTLTRPEDRWKVIGYIRKELQGRKE